MRKINIGILTTSLFLGLWACNNSSNQKAAHSDKNGMEAMPSMQRHTTGDSMPKPPADAKVYFVNLKNGQTVSSPFKVEMGVTDMTVVPAGEIKVGTGHHHLLIDTGDSTKTGETIPADEQHIHFGGGQTETEVKLPPGKHQLTLQFADGVHRSYGSQLAASITVTVK